MIISSSWTWLVCNWQLFLSLMMKMIMFRSWTVLVCSCRVYLGMHSLLDIICGLILSSMIMVTSIPVSKSYMKCLYVAFFAGFQWSIFERPTETSLFHICRCQNGLSSGLPNAALIRPFLLFYFFIHEGSYWSSCQSSWMSTQALKINLAWCTTERELYPSNIIWLNMWSCFSNDAP